MRRNLSSLVSSARSSRKKPTFGIAFDIDGVLIRGSHALPGATQALQRLYEGATPRVPFLLFTNGGGYTEQKKAEQLSGILKLSLARDQMFLSHTPFREHVKSFESKRVLAVGKGEPAAVLAEYGFRNVVSIEDYVDEFEDIDPLEQYKSWKRRRSLLRSGCGKIEGLFIVSDPVDWGRDIQVICDVLRGGGDPLRKKGDPPPLLFAADDLVYQAAFPVARFGMGAFRVALEAVYNRLTGTALLYSTYGKPTEAAYADARRALQRLAACDDLETIYMVGDNPATDILGARKAGKPWFSILVRSGCFGGKGNHLEHPADEVVEDVQEAVNYIFDREGIH